MKAAAPSITPMLPVLSFTPSVFGRMTVALGAEEIGEILPQDGGHCAWRVTVHGMRSSFSRADSVGRAQRSIERAVNDWLLRLGIFYPGQGVRVLMVDPSLASDGPRRASLEAQA